MLFDPFPATRESLASYSAYYVSIQGHKEESLTSIFSSIRYYHRDHGLPWINDSEAFFVSAVRKGLQKTQSNPGRTPKYALTTYRIDKIRTQLDLNQFAHLELLTLLRIGHDSLLRTGELLKLRWEDITFRQEATAAPYPQEALGLNSRRSSQSTELSAPRPPAAPLNSPTGGYSVSIYIHKSKMNKKGPPEQVLIPFYGLTSSPMLLRLYQQTYAQQRSQLYGPTAWLFPSWSGPLDTALGEPLSKTSLRRTLALFLEPTESPHSGYSLRSGGATDLFENGVAESLIKQQGRWASDAYRLYIRDNPKFQSQRLAAAFASARNAPSDLTASLCHTENNEHGQGISSIHIMDTDTHTLATAPDRGPPSSSSSTVSSTGERIMTSF
jgi:integrase